MAREGVTIARDGLPSRGHFFENTERIYRGLSMVNKSRTSPFSNVKKVKGRRTTTNTISQNGFPKVLY